jgi:hypothetical protein
VAVDTTTIESSQVFANLYGTFTQEMNAAPVRARKDNGTWAPIDTTLVRESDGGSTAPTPRTPESEGVLAGRRP